ncbi:5-methyltetrahydropteroyltriglutamate--homocysteine S-methyltransferase [Paludibacterium paludis]|nr:5-methyltetrahydropteroyltriglutamate--homocysteine S-methyltransferase [Paludibacterium paludis]
MTTLHTLGFPRIGQRRELKFALESYWAGNSDANTLTQAAQALRQRHWLQQRAAGAERIAVGDASLYDHVLDHLVWLGAIPVRFGEKDWSDPSAYFEPARGRDDQPALAMMKWFDTNYHYLVPEWSASTVFRPDPSALLAQLRECRALGIDGKPVLIGPVTLLWLGATHEPAFDRLSLLPSLVEAYGSLLSELAREGASWVQIDEPVLALDLDAAWSNAFAEAYRPLGDAPVKLLLATYFGGVEHHRDLIDRLPVDGLHLDLVRAPNQAARWLAAWPEGRILSVGIVDGRNVWRADLEAALQALLPLKARLGDDLWLSTSCSLLHCPMDAAQEVDLDAAVRRQLAFAEQKLNELATLGKALRDGPDSVAGELAASQSAKRSRAQDASAHVPQIRARVAEHTPGSERRATEFALRYRRQVEALALPPLPTTTIGSFPQTAHIRSVRAAWRRGEVDTARYEAAMREEIAGTIRLQEALGLDVLVHGEAERNDMVEYFGEQLDGYVFTRAGWVQSYGSRCVKPPILFGDVSRPAPMTVDWARYAQSLTHRPVKGMLTGPVTLLNWSFVREDLPRRDVARQLALALNEEVRDLEAAGIRVIQIDEPALREGLPLRVRERAGYLEWAAEAFRIAVGGVGDLTQIHTHMCYSKFDDILPAIVSMDADVVTIETSRSAMRLLDAFGHFRYPNAIGPGVYDIHSPRVPREEEMRELLERALAVIPAERLWINPDCGLKTRRREEVEEALRRMVGVASALRKQRAGS